MRNGRNRQRAVRKVAREMSTTHFAKPIIMDIVDDIVDEPLATSPRAEDDLLAGPSSARIAVCDAWDDVETQPDPFAQLFDTSNRDEVPTLTMRQPRPWTELDLPEMSPEPAEAGLQPACRSTSKQFRRER